MAIVTPPMLAPCLRSFSGPLQAGAADAAVPVDLASLAFLVQFLFDSRSYWRNGAGEREIR